MDVRPIEVFDETPNAAVVRMPNRRFPGVVVQGDSLRILLEQAREIQKRVAGNTDEELAGETDNLVSKLAAWSSHYEAVLARHGIGLPY